MESDRAAGGGSRWPAATIGAAVFASALAALHTGGCGSEAGSVVDPSTGTTSTTFTTTPTYATGSDTTGTTGGHGGSEPIGGAGGAGAGSGCESAAGGSGSSADVTVHVSAGAELEPTSGIPIVISNACGAVVEITSTGADGDAAAVVPPGGLVAAYFDEPLSRRSMTGVVDPPDGSTIWIWLLPRSPGPFPPTTSYDVTLSGYPSETVAISLHACGDDRVVSVAGPVSVGTVTQGNCLGWGSSSILALAYDAQDQPIAWGLADEVPLEPGGSVPVTIALDGASFMPFSLSVGPIDPTATKSVLMASIGAQTAPYLYAFEIQTPPAATESLVFALPDVSFWAAIEAMVYYDDGVHRRSYVATGNFTNLPLELDLDPTALPAILVDAVDWTDPRHPVLRWNATAGPAGDAMKLSLTNPAAGASFEIYLPPDRTSFRWPDVPDALAVFAPDYAEPPYPPCQWRGSVGHLDQHDAAGWSELYRFTSPIGWVLPNSLLVQSTGKLP